MLSTLRHNQFFEGIVDKSGKLVSEIIQSFKLTYSFPLCSIHSCFSHFRDMNCLMNSAMC